MLGGPYARRRREEAVLNGSCIVQSPHGLAPLTRLLIAALPKNPVERVLTGLDTEAAGAMLIRRAWPQAQLTWFHFDAYVGRKVRGVLDHNREPTVQTYVSADVPDGPFDLAALEFPKGRGGLLMLDIIEAVHAQLAIGGRLVAVTDSKPDALRSTLTKVFGKCVPAAVQASRGKVSKKNKKMTAFYAVRTKETPRVGNRAHVLTPTFEVNGQSIELQIETRPGTFAHGRIDRGTRALIEWIEPRAASRVLDLGAGCGAIGIAAAVAIPDAHVVLVDSNVRAIECAERNAARNGVADHVEALVRADTDELPGDGTYDLVLANPPYFSQFRIARAFVQTAYDALAPGGRFALVAKAGAAHAQHIRDVFDNAGIVERSGYAIVMGTRQAD